MHYHAGGHEFMDGIDGDGKKQRHAEENGTIAPTFYWMDVSGNSQITSGKAIYGNEYFGKYFGARLGCNTGRIAGHGETCKISGS